MAVEVILQSGAPAVPLLDTVKISTLLLSFRTHRSWSFCKNQLFVFYFECVVGSLRVAKLAMREDATKCSGRPSQGSTMYSTVDIEYQSKTSFMLQVKML